jgi:hypothetical protein
VLWWEPATDITGGTVTYDIEISSRADFADGSVIFADEGIANDPQRVEYELDRQSLPSGTWHYKVIANSGNFFQVANNVLSEEGVRYQGVRKFTIP